MKPGSKAKVISSHKFHPNREGIILFFCEEESSGVVVLRDLSSDNEVFAVKFNELISIE
jgi:hypothetical protein